MSKGARVTSYGDIGNSASGVFSGHPSAGIYLKAIAVDEPSLKLSGSMMKYPSGTVTSALVSKWKFNGVDAHTDVELYGGVGVTPHFMFKTCQHNFLITGFNATLKAKTQSFGAAGQGKEDFNIEAVCNYTTRSGARLESKSTVGKSELNLKGTIPVNNDLVIGAEANVDGFNGIKSLDLKAQTYAFPIGILSFFAKGLLSKAASPIVYGVQLFHKASSRVSIGAEASTDEKYRIGISQNVSPVWSLKYKLDQDGRVGVVTSHNLSSRLKIAAGIEADVADTKDLKWGLKINLQ
mmetsp:Transcript_7877/g.13704  ORF Transcript_7877/g.13704 Transcript_7877/m.13704 type:complete len:294 (+) Transcript_7877:34-915(+)